MPAILEPLAYRLENQIAEFSPKAEINSVTMIILLSINSNTPDKVINAKRT